MPKKSSLFLETRGKLLVGSPVAPKCELLFPTPVFLDFYPDMDEENNTIIAVAQELPPSGIRKTNIGGFQSTDDFIRHPVCRELVARIDQSLEAIQKNLNIVQTLVIAGGWININRKRDYNARHVHPRSYLSGVYYLKGDEQTGGLVFHTPLAAKEMLDPDFTKQPPFLWDTAQYNPLPGRCLFFPSWLQHSVFANDTDEDRISISFNVSFRKQDAADEMKSIEARAED